MSEPRFEGVFIGGCDRSGTTLLQTVLNSHPDVFVTYEMSVAVRMHGPFGRLDAAKLPELIKTLLARKEFAGISAEAVCARLSPTPCFADVVRVVYRLAAEQAGKTIWGDKSPRYANHFGFLAEKFPRCGLIHIYRDPRAIAYSLIPKPWGPNTAYHAATYWLTTVTNALQAGRLIGEGKFLNICYEDFVQEPERHAERVCAFLGIPMDAQMLAHDKRSEAVPTLTRAVHPHLQEQISTAQVDKWSAMPRRDLVTIEAVCGRLMDELGYPQLCGTDGRGVSAGQKVKYGLQARLRRLLGRSR